MRVQETHGSRPIPAGAVTGLQFMKTKGYIQITGECEGFLHSFEPNVENFLVPRLHRSNGSRIDEG